MSDEHGHDYPDEFGRVAHPGLPWPPPEDRVRGFAADQPAGDPPHFWRDGPVTAQAIPRRRVRTRAGTYATCTHEVRWFLDRVAGVSRARAIARVYDVVLDPDGWIQAGLHFKRVTSRADATILVRVIPQDETVCGPGAAGCYSYGFEPDGLPCAENGVEAIDTEGPWRVIVGMELCGHGGVKMEDMYTADHQPYTGSMGDWSACARVGYRPTRAEIEGARQWLAGTIDPARIHH